MAKRNKKSVSQLGREQINSDKIIYGIILLMLAVIPLVIRLAAVQNFSPTLRYSGDHYDLYTFYKFIWLLIGVSSLLAVYIYKIIREGGKLTFNYTTLPLLVLFVLILFSGVLAQYKTASFIGKFDRHEGTLAYLNYLILFFVIANTVIPGKKMNYIFYALYPLVVLNSLLGIISFYGFNLFDSAAFRLLIIPFNLRDTVIGSTLSSTLGNPNFAGGLGAILTTLFFTRATLTCNLKEKLWNIFFALLSFIILLTSFSSGGFISLVALLPIIILIIIFSKVGKHGVITFLATILTFLMVFMILNTQTPRVKNEYLGVSAALSNQTWTKADKEFNLPPLGLGAGSGRLYIWEKTFSLIKNRPWFGYGLDTLAYYFPQDDPGKASALADPKIYVDKAHNMYIGLTYGAGVLALGAFIILIWRHLWVYLIILKKPVNTERRIILASLFMAWCTYLVQTLFNDSTIGIAVVFWILFGFSVSLVREELK